MSEWVRESISEWVRKSMSEWVKVRVEVNYQARHFHPSTRLYRGRESSSLGRLRWRHCSRIARLRPRSTPFLISVYFPLQLTNFESSLVPGWVPVPTLTKWDIFDQTTRHYREDPVKLDYITTWTKWNSVLEKKPTSSRREDGHVSHENRPSHPNIQE